MTHRQIPPYVWLDSDPSRAGRDMLDLVALDTGLLKAVLYLF